MEISEFDQWNEVQKALEQKERQGFFKERQIWWCAIGRNIGWEIYGKGSLFSRPVLIYKKLSQDIFLGLPLSTQVKKGGSWYIKISHRGQNITVLLNQARVFDKKRLLDRYGEINDKDFLRIKDSFSLLYGL
jgi:mRNA interferase MazF